jgi:hypothetical protein
VPSAPIVNALRPFGSLFKIGLSSEYEYALSDCGSIFEIVGVEGCRSDLGDVAVVVVGVQNPLVEIGGDIHYAIVPLTLHAFCPLGDNTEARTVIVLARGALLQRFAFATRR